MLAVQLAFGEFRTPKFGEILSCVLLIVIRFSIRFVQQIHGLASPIRFLLEVAGADYEEELYSIEDKEKWFGEKRESLGNRRVSKMNECCFSTGN